MWIVLAKVKYEMIMPGRWQPKPVALSWLRDGSNADFEKAKAFASKEGYTVFTYGSKEVDPLGKAKRALTPKET